MCAREDEREKRRKKVAITNAQVHHIRRALPRCNKGVRPGDIGTAGARCCSGGLSHEHKEKRQERGGRGSRGDRHGRVDRFTLLTDGRLSAFYRERAAACARERQTVEMGMCACAKPAAERVKVGKVERGRDRR